MPRQLVTAVIKELDKPADHERITNSGAVRTAVSDQNARRERRQVQKLPVHPSPWPGSILMRITM